MGQADQPLGTLFVVSAPSGAGKTSLVRALVSTDPGIAVSVSHTTRAPRPGEQDGTHYHFVDRARFEDMAAAGELLEHARVFDNYYGTARAEVEQGLAAGRDLVLEIDWQGARQVRALMPQAVSIFILPPSIAVLEQRLRDRAQDSAEVVAQRLSEARGEMSHYEEFDYLVVNDDLDAALHELRAIVTSHRLRRDAQVRRQAGRLAELLRG